MSNLSMSLLIVLSINVFLMFGQVAIASINPAQESINLDGTLLTRFQTNETYVLQSDDPAGAMPDSESNISPDTGNIFTDGFTAIKNWLLDTLGLGYLFSLLGAPYRFLVAIHMPQAFSFGVGALWYGYTLFLIVSFLIGRDS